MNEAKSYVLVTLLTYLNKGIRAFTLSEIATGAGNEMATGTIQSILRFLCDGKILKSNGDKYEILVGIDRMREFVLKQSPDGEGSKGVGLDVITNSEWRAIGRDTDGYRVPEYVRRLREKYRRDRYGCDTIVDTWFPADGNDSHDGDKDDEDGNADECEDGEDDEDDGGYDDLISAKRRLFEQHMRQMQSMFDDEDDDEDDENDNDDGTDDDGRDDISVPEIDMDYDDIDLRLDVLRACIKRQDVSVCYIERTFNTGYIRATEIIDWMEDNRFISKRAGSKLWKVLIDETDFENIFGEQFCRNGEKTVEENNGEKLSEGRKLGSYLIKRADEYDKRFAAQSLVNALSRVAEKKNAVITGDRVPDRFLWDEDEFDEAVTERLVRIIKSDKRMGRRGAIKKAETYLEAVRDTRDGKMVQVYERIVYEFKFASDRLYLRLRKQLFE